jgi:hypothetical protein
MPSISQIHQAVFGHPKPIQGSLPLGNLHLPVPVVFINEYLATLDLGPAGRLSLEVMSEAPQEFISAVVGGDTNYFSPIFMSEEQVLAWATSAQFSIPAASSRTVNQSEELVAIRANIEKMEALRASLIRSMTSEQNLSAEQTRYEELRVTVNQQTTEITNLRGTVNQQAIVIAHHQALDKEQLASNTQQQALIMLRQAESAKQQEVIAQQAIVIAQLQAAALKARPVMPSVQSSPNFSTLPQSSPSSSNISGTNPHIQRSSSDQTFNSSIFSRPESAGASLFDTNSDPKNPGDDDERMKGIDTNNP